MSKRTPLIAGNWKMNGSVSFTSDLIAAMGTADKPSDVDVVVCPPFPFLALAADKLKGSGIGLGAQTCHAAASGAHTGDVSAEMLSDVGCTHVIVGHSERRTDHAERDDEVRTQAEAAFRTGLTAIICVGETETERDAGTAIDVVRAQVTGALPDGATGTNTVIAYEPVWAIGTGRTPSTDDVQEMHAEIRNTLTDLVGAETAQNIRILYGGSMKPANAAEFIALNDVDGGLIGGASLEVVSFLAIAAAAE